MVKDRLDYDSIMLELNDRGFDWLKFREYFPFGDISLREGEYSKVLDKIIELLTNAADKELILDLLDIQFGVFLEQLWIQNEKCTQGGTGNLFPGEINFVLARLQINSNLRSNYNLTGTLPQDMRRMMMNIGENNTLAKILCGN